MRVARQKSLRPGTDLVFSAPKSVSMQWAALAATGDVAGAQVIEQAHDRAVRETFERLQSEFVMTRKRDSETSRRIFETVRGVIASQWRHFDARPTQRQGAKVAVPDPQLHDHINLFAPVQGADGQIYSAYTDYIRQNVIEALIDQGRSVRDAKLHSRQAKNSLSGSEVLAAWGRTFAALGMDPQAVKVAGVDASIEREVQFKRIPAAGQPFRAAISHSIQADRGGTTMLLLLVESPRLNCSKCRRTP